MDNKLKIREVCGDYALDIPFADGSVNTIYFNSKRNAETVKHIIEIDDSNPKNDLYDFSRIKIKLKVVDEVKLSKWVKKKVRKVCEAEAYCLTCGREVVYQVINNRYQFENYCPHCGARMDLEDKEND